MIKYQLNRSNNVVEAVYDREINLDDVLSYARELANENDLPRKLRIISDSRMAKYTFSKNAISEVIEALEELCSKYEFIKVAFIQNKPKETAYSSILANKQKIPNYYHQIFSTPEAALSWLISEQF